MSANDDFNVLLDATLSHLEDLRKQGQRSLVVDPTLLAELTAPAARLKHPPTTPATPPPTPDARPRIIQPLPQEAPIGRLPSIRLSPATSSQSAGAPTVPPLSGAQKEAAMAELRARVLPCVQCTHLAGSRKNVVFGVGTVHSPILFVGEAPGAEEDVQGEPFVGAAGQLLTRIIQTMGLTRETVYIANVLKCRPDTPGQQSGNRKPRPEEMATCLPYLREQIRIIQPKVIVALGATAMEGLFGRSPGYITKIRGHWMSYEGLDVMPTYHPAYLLRNQNLAAKRETWEDMLQAMERLGMPISDKQRGYFR